MSLPGWIVAKEFEPAGIYLNTASIGLPPRRAVAALHAAIETWRTGRAEAAAYDEVIEQARRQFAGLVGVTPDRVFFGNQVSTFTALVAAALPDGAQVLAAKEDFTSAVPRTGRRPASALHRQSDDNR